MRIKSSGEPILITENNSLQTQKPMYCSTEATKSQLRSDEILVWLNTHWNTRFPTVKHLSVWSNTNSANDQILNRLDRSTLFAGYQFQGYRALESDVVNTSVELRQKGIIAEMNGAFVYRFVSTQTLDLVEVALVATHYRDESYYRVAIASIPESFKEAWEAFEIECNRLAFAYEVDNRVVVIGGRHNSFVPTVSWDDVILQPELKSQILEDVQSFFNKGVNVYKRLNLKPFRKLLLAGVPGTGKTMICNALAKWAIAQKYLVVYVSSAQKQQGDEYGSTFSKIQYALDVAASSEHPTMIILEELDAYLHDNEKALILNVLDGAESTMNPSGTLLVSTTNYPEAIDERILKRPGRLDRIFIIPEVKTELNAAKMLKHYLGDMWQEEHMTVVPQLLGYPGAFIREMAIYALTQVAYDDLTELSLELLEKSFNGLKEQLATRDEFLKQRDTTPTQTPSETPTPEVPQPETA
jgi:AAA+ superfamily predicted ATPase